jgi:hypothetical protein
VPMSLRLREGECLERLRGLAHVMAAPHAAEVEAAQSATYATLFEAYNQVLHEIAPYAPSYVDCRRGVALSFERVRAILAS